jgi:hypothetical protein
MGQQFYLGSGFASAGFNDYSNSFGENTLDDSGYSKPKEFLLEGGFLFNIYKEKIKLDAGFHFNKNAINTSFYSGNITVPIAYDLSYAGLSLGLNFTLITWRSIKLQVNTGYSYNGLMDGTAKYTDVVVDVYKEKTFDRSLHSYHIGFGFEYKVLEKISAYLNYDLAKSLRENNPDGTGDEKYELERRAISIGLLFDISKKKPETKNKIK